MLESIHVIVKLQRKRLWGITDFMILRKGKSGISKIKTLDFKRADFNGLGKIVCSPHEKTDQRIKKDWQFLSGIVWEMEQKAIPTW